MPDTADVALRRYREKRNPTKTSEPMGSTRSTGSDAIFVVQKHRASHLHYDFRLERGGVLLSWAIPKGPSLDPHQKRLAVHVEDHPLDYARFESQIRAGEYGAGSVIVWDIGTWEPIGDFDKMFEEGVLKILLKGERLHGAWALIRMKPKDDDGDPWLLVKEKDEFADPDSDVVEQHQDSVLKPAPLTQPVAPERFRPMQPTLVAKPPTDERWIHEIKLDGYRIVAWRLEGEVKLMSRNGIDWTHRFPEIAKVLFDHTNAGTAIDGEVVVFDRHGKSTFGGLQSWLKTGKSDSPVFCAFDLLWLDGVSIAKRKTEERKNDLERLLDTMPKSARATIRYSEHMAGSGEGFLQAACEAGLEGIVSKRKDARYFEGRSTQWVKTKCVQSDEFVVGGYTDAGGERTGFGALLVGMFDDSKKLVYMGRVGTGFAESDLRDILAALRSRSTTDCPFSSSHEIAKAHTHWVEPTLVAEVKFTEKTQDGRLRHPVFLRLRDDKRASDVRVAADEDKP